MALYTDICTWAWGVRGGVGEQDFLSDFTKCGLFRFLRRALILARAFLFNIEWGTSQCIEHGDQLTDICVGVGVRVGAGLRDSLSDFARCVLCRFLRCALILARALLQYCMEWSTSQEGETKAKQKSGRGRGKGDRKVYRLLAEVPHCRVLHLARIG